MSENNPLGDYLRARREQVRPEEVGLPAGSTRRVPGLRREEVALLAGISSDYYLRLEQGRDRHPSPQVLQALGRVLLLDATAVDHLLSLGAPRLPRRRARREPVPIGTRQLLDVLGLPAFVEGRYFDVLAATALATAISPFLAEGRNRLRALFLDPTEQDLYPEWELATENLVAGFRTSVGTEVDDPGVVQLVGELSLGSDRFRQLWARHDVRPLAGGSLRLAHPQVGELKLRREKLAIGGTAGQVLVIYHAEPGSPSAEKLSILASLASMPADPREPDGGQAENERDELGAEEPSA
jgi:transcriptional regulator with XRE-family HTH domain